MTATEAAGVCLMPFAAILIFMAERTRRARSPAMESPSKSNAKGKDRKPKPVVSRDEHLRACGWRVYSRPRTPPDLWEWRHGPGVWFHVPVEEAVAITPLVLGGWERTSYEDRGERVWILRGGKGAVLLVLRQSEAIAQAAKIMQKYADVM